MPLPAGPDDHAGLLRPLASQRDPTMPRMSELMRPLPRAFAGAAPALLLRPVYGGSLAGVVLAGAVAAALGLAGPLLAAVGPAELRRLADVPRSLRLLRRERERHRSMGEAR